MLSRGVNGGEWPLPDRNGNTAYVTGTRNPANNVAYIRESYRYDAFGTPTIFNASIPSNPVITSSAIGNRFLFTGREYNSEFGFYEYRARAYHPGLGRFMSEDPKGFDAGDYNFYRYCGNDPLDETDAMGLSGDQKEVAYHPINPFISTLREGPGTVGAARAASRTPLTMGLVNLSDGNERQSSAPPGTVHRAPEEIAEREVDVVTNRSGQPLVDAQGNPWRGATRWDMTATQENPNEFTLHLKIDTQLAKIGTPEERTETLKLERGNQAYISKWYHSSETGSRAFFAALKGRSNLETEMKGLLREQTRRRQRKEQNGLNSLDR